MVLLLGRGIGLSDVLAAKAAGGWAGVSMYSSSAFCPSSSVEIGDIEATPKRLRASSTVIGQVAMSQDGRERKKRKRGTYCDYRAVL